MSDFFANVGGFRMPDVRMNQGPLPSVVGGPVGTDGTPDGVINGTNRLLSGITPYAYGESARMGSDSNYQQIPHRVQYIVPPLYLPSQNSETVYRVCHVVDNGDLAFVLNTRGRQWFGTGDTVMNIGPGTLPVFGNLEVVNYILACLQLAPTNAQNAGGAGGAGANGKRSWTKIREHLWSGMFNEEYLDTDKNYVHHMFKMVMYTVENLLKPHGICAGSEYQGGQHEESWAPVQAAVNYTTTMTVDGQNRDLVNYWHEQCVYAGDRLLLRLMLTPNMEKEWTREYQLTSYHERPISGTVTTNRAYWQLEPWILNAEDHKTVSENMRRYDYHMTGYWHIAQSFQGRHGSGLHRGLRFKVPPGAPLQVTFAPMFMRNGKADDFVWNWFEFLEGINPQIYALLARNTIRQGAEFFDVMFAYCQQKSIEITSSEKIFVENSKWTEMRDLNVQVQSLGKICCMYYFAKESGSMSLKTTVLKNIENFLKIWTGGGSIAEIDAKEQEQLQYIFGVRTGDYLNYYNLFLQNLRGRGGGGNGLLPGGGLRADLVGGGLRADLGGVGINVGIQLEEPEQVDADIGGISEIPELPVKAVKKRSKMSKLLQPDIGTGESVAETE